MKLRYLFIGGLFYAAGITIIGICDTLNGGVEKRAKAQERRSERLKRNQIALQERVARRQDSIPPILINKSMKKPCKRQNNVI